MKRTESFVDGGALFGSNISTASVRMTFSEELKSQLDIVDVIGQYVRLKRSGYALQGTMPIPQ